MDLQINELKDRLATQGLGVQLTNDAKKLIVDKGYDASNGVRPLRRVIQDEIEDHLANGVLDGSYVKGDVVNVGVKKKQLAFNKVSG